MSYYGCEDCGSVHVNCPMLVDELWLSIADKEAQLCWSCAEHRLGRDIHVEDLLDCGWTHDFMRVAHRVNAGRWFRDGRAAFVPDKTPTEEESRTTRFRRILDAVRFIGWAEEQEGAAVHHDWGLMVVTVNLMAVVIYLAFWRL